jgi:CRISPR-associated endonuclease/helicase Cas3
MDTIDLLFPAVGSQIPVEHGYALYSALSHQLKCLHDGSVPFGLAPVNGLPVGGGKLQLDPTSSRLRLRVAASSIPQLLPLAGKRLDIKGHPIRLGVPSVAALRPVPVLIARMVAIKLAKPENVAPAPDAFLAAARRQLSELGVRGTLRIPEHVNKRGQREPIRRVLRIKEKAVIGYALLVEGLTPEDSIQLQDKGLGGRARMGCGFFLPTEGDE